MSSSGWGPYGPPSTWGNSYVELPASVQQRPVYDGPSRTAAEIFNDAERADQDFGLRVYMDYSELFLPGFIHRMSHLTPDQQRAPLRSVATPEQLQGFILIQDLTLEQVKRVQEMKIKRFLGKKY